MNNDVITVCLSWNTQSRMAVIFLRLVNNITTLILKWYKPLFVIYPSTIIIIITIRDALLVASPYKRSLR